MKLYMVAAFRWPDGDVSGHLIAETGEVVASHMSSNSAWLRYDLVQRRAEVLAKLYPDGYTVVDMLDNPDPLAIPEFHEVFQRNQELKRQSEAARQAV